MPTDTDFLDSSAPAQALPDTNHPLQRATNLTERAALVAYGRDV